jgi:UDP-N-acetylglucosamine--N-acetylmuramyl-(pentapeptide) pyrophosphoryl-undecaprenol N-acetylglucosamine transferase
MQGDSRRSGVAIFAGGTGGHVFPALAVASELDRRGYAVHWFGTERGLESRVVPEAGFPLHQLRVSGIRGKGVTARLRGLVGMVVALLQALVSLGRIRPVVALGMGGYVAGPAGLASWLLRIPLVIHEQNSVAGTTNRLLRRFARVVLTAYPDAFGGNTTRQVGNPVRTELLARGAAASYDYDGSRPLRLLVVGGSQGALAINSVLPPALAAAGAAVEVRHQTGVAHADTVRALYGENPGSSVEILPFIEDMAGAYEWADLVLCRAGALTLAELTIMGRPAILVPLPNAIDNHQARNAQWLVKQGGAVLLPQSEMSAESVARLLREFCGTPERLRQMAAAARAAARPDATAEVADICEELRRGR